MSGETFQSTKTVRCDFVDHLLNLILGRLEAEVKCKTKTDYNGERNYEFLWSSNNKKPEK